MTDPFIWIQASDWGMLHVEVDPATRQEQNLATGFCNLTQDSGSSLGGPFLGALFAHKNVRIGTTPELTFRTASYRSTHKAHSLRLQDSKTALQANRNNGRAWESGSSCVCGSLGRASPTKGSNVVSAHVP